MIMIEKFYLAGDKNTAQYFQYWNFDNSTFCWFNLQNLKNYDKQNTKENINSDCCKL